jgi:uracil-DNA glycosylase family 4
MRKHPLAKCEECPLQNERMAASCGPKDAKVAVVSRSPGAYDVRTGTPFSNPNGSKKILDFLFESNGVKREDVFLTNLVLCYSDDPTKEAIKACSLRLQNELESIQTIIAAGSEAVREFIGPIAIQKARGLEHTKNNKRTIATNNPAAVLYDSDSFPNLVEDFKLALNPPPEVVYPKVEILNDPSKAKKFLSDIRGLDQIISTDLEGRTPHIECAGFSIDPNSAVVIPRRILVKVWDEFKLTYESNEKWLWHNGVYDCKLLRRNDISSRITHDTYPLSYVLDERTLGVHKLEYLARTQLGWGNYEPESVDHYKETGILPDDIDELHTYNGYDCAGTYQLFNLLSGRALEDETWGLYESHMIPLMNALVDVELRGFPYDKNAAADLNEEVVLPEMRRLIHEMKELTGLGLFNPASHQQVNAFAYETCGLVHNLKDTRKKKYSHSFADAIRVEILADRYKAKPRYMTKIKEFAKLHDEWSEIDTQRGRYIEGLIKLVGDDGKLYCEFNPCGTVTGRTSARRPNFQNITRTERNVVPAIRNLFKPSPGNVIVQADYSQAELRCIARFSQDSELLSIYRDTNRSLHKETASAFYGVSYTKEQYTKSKNINFGVCYGQSAFAFAQMYHMDQNEAQAYIDKWFIKFPKVKEWIVETHKVIRTENYLVNPFGRKRRFYLITEENLGDTLREGVNFLPQSTASEFTVAALCDLNSQGVPIISTVHDSIIADVPQKEAKEVAILMKEVMEAQPSEKLGWDDIPFVVDISMSESSWGECAEIEMEVELVT